VPSRLLPKDIGATFTTAAGYSRFGHQSLDLSGFALPAYLNLQAGVTITRKTLNLDLRVGLTSRWCSATFVAKLWFALK
jgi:hypothetical protein